MKTIGIIGGISYESSIHYYERINDQVNKIAGKLIRKYSSKIRKCRSRLYCYCNKHNA